ncbi:MAG: ABC transporter permease [Clostridiales bacterium]|nr:ABC transporter permease [Clostridiales bacterium]
MKRMLAFALRVAKETLRDPVTLIFGVGLPVALLVLMSIIQRSVPVEIFAISRLAPGMAAFSLAFTAMFAAILISKDKSTSFLLRVFASPMRPWEYILGYALPMLPIGTMQCAVCFAAALCFGLPFSGKLLLAVLALLPAAAVYVSFGLLFGVLLTDKQAAPVSSILVQCAALLGGIWFDPVLIGGAFETVCDVLPFVHAAGAAAAVFAGDGAAVISHILPLFGWTAVLFAAAVFLFRRKMRAD